MRDGFFFSHITATNQQNPLGREQILSKNQHITSKAFCEREQKELKSEEKISLQTQIDGLFSLLFPGDDQSIHSQYPGRLFHAKKKVDKRKGHVNDYLFLGHETCLMQTNEVVCSIVIFHCPIRIRAGAKEWRHFAMRKDSAIKRGQTSHQSVASQEKKYKCSFTDLKRKKNLLFLGAFFHCT